MLTQSEKIDQEEPIPPSLEPQEAMTSQQKPFETREEETIQFERMDQEEPIPLSPEPRRAKTPQ